MISKFYLKAKMSMNVFEATLNDLDSFETSLIEDLKNDLRHLHQQYADISSVDKLGESKELFTNIDKTLRTFSDNKQELELCVQKMGNQNVLFIDPKYHKSFMYFIPSICNFIRMYENFECGLKMLQNFETTFDNIVKSNSEIYECQNVQQYFSLFQKSSTKNIRLKYAHVKLETKQQFQRRCEFDKLL